MAGIGQYLKETRGELRHVAWPTHLQTIVYTVLVALISVGVALYLGLFDFLFTGALSRVLNVLPAVSPVSITQQPLSTTSIPAANISTTTKAK